MFFDPRTGSVNNEQARGVFVYGDGVDVPVSTPFLMRAQYRGFVCTTPDFEQMNLKVDKYTHSAVLSRARLYVLGRP